MPVTSWVSEVGSSKVGKAKEDIGGVSVGEWNLAFLVEL